METWTFSWALRNLGAEFLMPPGIWLLVILFAVLILKKRPSWRTAGVLISCLMIWFSSTQAFYFQLFSLANGVMHWPAPYEVKHVDAQSAIVILGGGRTKGAVEYPEYQNQDLSKESFMRLRMGVRVAKVTNLPILVTGGAPDRINQKDLSEAEVMAKVLEREFQVKAKWLETQSQTTQENAQFSKEILKSSGVKHIYLVTHIWHMPRAQNVFENYGFDVTPVPIGFQQKNDLTPLDYYPSAQGFTNVRHLWHEILGKIWYELRY